jgi:hypothetical protein
MRAAYDTSSISVFWCCYWLRAAFDGMYAGTDLGLPCTSTLCGKKAGLSCQGCCTILVCDHSTHWSIIDRQSCWAASRCAASIVAAIELEDSSCWRLCQKWMKLPQMDNIVCIDTARWSDTYTCVQTETALVLLSARTAIALYLDHCHRQSRQSVCIAVYPAPGLLSNSVTHVQVDECSLETNRRHLAGLPCSSPTWVLEGSDDGTIMVNIPWDMRAHGFTSNNLLFAWMGG